MARHMLVYTSRIGYSALVSVFGNESWDKTRLPIIIENQPTPSLVLLNARNFQPSAFPQCGIDIRINQAFNVSSSPRFLASIAMANFK